MFETAELGAKVAKTVYKKEVEKLRVRLLAAQQELASSGLSAIIVIGGVEGSGKTELANLMLEWLDPHGIEVHALGEPSDEERERPRFWRFWRALPPKGRIGIFIGSWYTDPIVDRVFRRTKGGRLDAELDRIVDFEKMLIQENVVLLKFWLHLAKDVQEKRFRRLEQDPDTRWRVTKQDWKFVGKYDKFRKICERAIMKTSTGQAPWRVIDAEDRRHRNSSVGRMTLQVLQERLKAARADQVPALPAKAPKPKKGNILSSIDLTAKLGPKEYEDRLAEGQARFNRLTRKLHRERRSMILVFEGSDAAGKGGAIRRLTQAMDARNYRVIATAAPTDEERARPYLWRFWRGLPRLGRVAIYDRSWYGRVLVERLEGFCRPEAWQRAYEEICAFESELCDFGTIIVKYWIQVSQEEQLRRFKERQNTPFKQYKITAEDWRNREKWGAYQAAACDMVERTSTATAPWVLVSGEDKSWARIKVLEAACENLERALE